MTLPTGNGRARLLWTLAGAAALIAGWTLLAHWGRGLFLADPLETFRALATLAGTASFRATLAVSLGRITAGVAIGAAAGAILGLAAGLRREVAWFLEPLRWALMSVPAVVLVVVAMLVFGLGSVMVVVITALLVAPPVYVNTFSGVVSVDPGILDMATVYRFPWWMRIGHIYGPAVAGSLLAGLALAVGMGVRVVILAEVLGAAEGIGHALTMSRTVLDVPVLTAWVVVSVLIVGAAEYLVLRPLERRAMRWRR